MRLSKCSEGQDGLANQVGGGELQKLNQPPSIASRRSLEDIFASRMWTAQLLLPFENFKREGDCIHSYNCHQRMGKRDSDVIYPDIASRRISGRLRNHEEHTQVDSLGFSTSTCCLQLLLKTPLFEFSL